MEVSARLLSSFDEPVVFRDPHARTFRPNVAVQRTADGPRLYLLGRASIRQRFTVTPEQGRLFVDTTRDPNSLHVEGDVVPGSYLWAKVLFGLEVLFPQFEILEMKTRFTSLTRYGESLLSEWRYLPLGGQRLNIEVQIYRFGEVVSSSSIRGRVRDEPILVRLAPRKVNQSEFDRVCAFSGSLGIDPMAYFEKPEGLDCSYPFAYVASLPSGALVRTLKGDGGILGSLKLSFLAEKKRAIRGPGPEVTVEPRRWRKAWGRIVTAIKEGVTTYLLGSALVARPTA